VPHVLLTVRIPCREASIWVGGEAVDGSPELAAIAEAEVWCRLG
jgi:hypothetical protein